MQEENQDAIACFPAVSWASSPKGLGNFRNLENFNGQREPTVGPRQGKGWLPSLSCQVAMVLELQQGR
jgi:hypothetical protein